MQRFFRILPEKEVKKRKKTGEVYAHLRGDGRLGSTYPNVEVRGGGSEGSMKGRESNGSEIFVDLIVEQRWEIGAGLTGLSDEETIVQVEDFRD